jgi:tetratricopeptide (TPR) repeat protein
MTIANPSRARTVILANLLSRIFSRRAPHVRLIDRSAFDSILQRGYRSECAGDAAQAEKLYRRALQIDSASVDAHYLLGALLGKKGELHGAAALLQRAVEAKPEFADAHAALGNVYLLQKLSQAAAASYREAIRLDPEHVPAHSNLGLIYKTDGNHAAALQCFTRAYDLAPQRPEALKNMALAWIELEQFEYALSQLHRLLRERPVDYEVLICLGFTLQKIHRPDEALDIYLRAYAQNSSDAELLNNLGIVLQDLGRIEEAIISYDRAVALKPDFEAASWHRALAYLLRYDFARGWPDYDLRLLSIDPPPRPAVYPRWDGSDLSGRGILVYAEQGLGDEIMFSSCLPQVIAASRHCVVECSPKLEALFRRSFPVATVYAMTEARDFPPVVHEANVELQIAMGSLPQFLRRTLADFPLHRGYLTADPQRVEYWHARLEALGRGLKVGISWQGGTPKTRRPLRSLPLAQWLPILRTPGATFINLQYTESSEEIAGIKACTGIEVVDWPEARDDYDRTAALVSALDLVISVCTAVIHLGGALGKPVWVLAPYSPEWRYGIAGEKMPWYPSVRVFRQPRYADWEPAIERIADELRQRADSTN